MVDQQAVSAGMLVEATLLDVLQHDVFAVVVGIGNLVALAAFLQRSDVAQKSVAGDGLNSGPSHDLLFPGRIEARSPPVVVIQSVVHDVPRLHALVVDVAGRRGGIEVGQSHAV